MTTKTRANSRPNFPEIQRYEQFHWGEINPFKRIGSEDFFNDHTLWFAYGRQALHYGLSVLGLTVGDTVLVPEYICSVVESSFAKGGINITYYRIKEDLSPDFVDIEKRIDKRTKALLTVNYFGFPGPIQEIKEFCAAHSLFFIEDNAHGFLNKTKGQWLGTFGDIGFTCPRKTVPLIHGAILYVNPTLGKRVSPPERKGYKVSKSSLKFFIYYLSRVLLHMPVSPFPQIRSHLRRKKVSLWGNALHDLPDKFMEIRLNLLVPVIIKLLNYQKVYKNKMEKYERVTAFLREQTLFSGELFFKDIPEEIIPLQIPFLLNHGEKDKSELLTVLNQNGVGAFYWPDLPQRVFSQPDRYPMANYLKNNLLHFPV